MERFNSYWYLSPLWQRRTGDTTPSLEEATPDRHDRRASKRIQDNKMIIDKGGFVLIFESQIYELSQDKLVERLKVELGLPVDCPKAIPEGILDRFVKWHERKNV
jgi:hypothetical protein